MRMGLPGVLLLALGASGFGTGACVHVDLDVDHIYGMRPATAITSKAHWLGPQDRYAAGAPACWLSVGSLIVGHTCTCCA